MAQADIQALIDTSGTGRGLRILRRVGGDSTTLSSYYIADHGGAYAGRARWIDTTLGDSDADQATAILAGMA